MERVMYIYNMYVHYRFYNRLMTFYFIMQHLEKFLSEIHTFKHSVIWVVYIFCINVTMVLQNK